jgi:hypothetical protein
MRDYLKGFKTKELNVLFDCVKYVMDNSTYSLSTRIILLTIKQDLICQIENTKKYVDVEKERY